MSEEFGATAAMKCASDLISNLYDKGVRLFVAEDGELKAALISGEELEDADRGALQSFKKEVLEIVWWRQRAREREVEERASKWRSYCTEERGYQWRVSDWRTAHTAMRLLDVRKKFVRGLATIEDVYVSFAQYAAAHKLGGVADQLDAPPRLPAERIQEGFAGGQFKPKPTPSVTPQTELDEEGFSVMCRYFGADEETEKNKRNK